MKQVYVSLALASALFALVGAIFFVRSVDSSREASKASLARVEASTAVLDAKLKAVMERVENMEKALSRRQVKAALVGSSAAEEPEPEASSMTGRRASWKEKRQALALLLSDEEANDLRSFVAQVIEEQRQEALEGEGRQGEEGVELEGPDKEPYGKFTYRVDSIAKKLDLNESQKERYYTLLSDYSAKIEENRKGLDRDDPMAYKAYRERKQQIIAEFDGLVAQTLTPQQAQEYQKMDSHDRSPALENATRVPVTAGGKTPQRDSTPQGAAVPRPGGNAEAESRSSTKSPSR